MTGRRRQPPEQLGEIITLQGPLRAFFPQEAVSHIYQGGSSFDSPFFGVIVIEDGVAAVVLSWIIRPG